MTTKPDDGGEAPARGDGSAGTAAVWRGGIGIAATLGVLLIWAAATGRSTDPGLALLAIAVTGAWGLWAWRTTVRARRARLLELGRRIASLGQLSAREGAGPRGPERPDEVWLDELVAARDEVVQQRLRELLVGQAQGRAILEATDAPVFAADEQGRVVACNRAGERLFSRRSGRLTGLMLDDLFPSTKLLALHARARGGVAGRGDVSMTFDGTPRVFEVSAVPARPAIADLPARVVPRAMVVLTLRDVTDVAQTVRLRSDFVANASHELRTPIASIRAAVETMRSVPADDAAMHAKLLTILQSNVMRLEEMVADLLDLSGLESADHPVRAVPLPFGEVAATMADLFDSACRKRGLELAFEIDPRLDRLIGDPKLLHLILRNLIDNATKFAFENTAIRVVAEATAPGELLDEGESVERRPGALASEAAGPGAADRAGMGGLRVRVIDRGVGIPLKHQGRIFERFYQVDPSRARGSAARGTGLGLAIVKHATRRLGGDVTVESVWQQGTTMTVEVPGCVPWDGGGAATG